MGRLASTSLRSAHAVSPLKAGRRTGGDAPAAHDSPRSEAEWGSKERLAGKFPENLCVLTTRSTH